MQKIQVVNTLLQTKIACLGGSFRMICMVGVSLQEEASAFSNTADFEKEATRKHQECPLALGLCGVYD